ncbi:hypothetical protein [Burkholderia ambifaria]|uniref:hypothetical protein n=1 Tax=Burkholderia ambifaria TaxID=152480 RepID=UPI002FE0F5D6
MNAGWSDFVDALGKEKSSDNVSRLAEKIGEVPIISETPDDFNDAEGKTTYWRFVKSGIEIGFRADKLNHIHLFVVLLEGCGSYGGDVLGYPANTWTWESTKSRLGVAAIERQGYEDGLLGYIFPWSKYEFFEHSVRMEYLQDSTLRKVSII